MKRSISVFLSVVTLLAFSLLTPVCAFATQPSEDIEPTMLQNSSAYYSYSCATKTLTISGTGAIPNFTNSSGSSTSQPWFDWRSDGSIEHLIIDEGITAIGNFAFYGLSVVDVSFPSTLVTIGVNSMASMNIASPITFPEGLKTISNNAFYYSRGIENITIPSTVTSIGISAFECCYNLKNVDFENLNSTVIIGKRAFFKCAELETITIPKNASLQAYSVGFYQASKGSVYESTTMRVFKNSTAYNYAVKNFVNYELIEKIPIYEGDCVEAEFTDNDLDDIMSFSFIPDVSAQYQFFSVGDVDLRCELKYGDTVLAESDDVTNLDSDFYISYYLNAGEEYVFVVSTNHFAGIFEVNLIPQTVAQVTCSVTQVQFSANERRLGKYDVLSKLYAAQLDFIFDTGYSGSMMVSEGVFRHYCNIEYSDNQYGTLWECGEHTAYIGLGGAQCEVSVTVNHSYEEEVIDPTDTEKGYTIFTCVGCDDVYIADYTDSLTMLVKGRVVLMEAPDGAHPHGLTIPYIEIAVDGIDKAVTGIDGEFEFRVDSTSQNIIFVGVSAIPRTVELEADDGVADLGDVPIANFDYYSDGYINAKDYATLRSIFGYYGSGNYEIIDSIDYNHDGIINDNDWIGAGAPEFYSYGKLDSSIYTDR